MGPDNLYTLVSGDDDTGDDDTGVEFEVLGSNDVAGDDDTGAEFEVLGPNDVAGDDDTGALFRFLKRKHKRKASTTPQVIKVKKRSPAPHPSTSKANPRMPIIREKGITSSRSYQLPISSGGAAIPAGASLTISVQPQVPLFQPKTLQVSGGIAPSFVITAFLVGQKNQFAASGPVPADSYIPTSTVTQGPYDTCYSGMSVTLTVQNISGAAAAFYGTVMGESPV